MSDLFSIEQTTPVALSRRGFLHATLTAYGAFMLSPVTNAFAQPAVPAPAPRPLDFISLSPAGEVTICSKYLDKGQGIATGVATLVADEMDMDISRVKVTFAPADVSKYKNMRLGVQGVGSSTSMADGFTELRVAGAAMRAMLVSAGAVNFGVPESEITTDNGRVVHAKSGRSTPYEQLLARAAALPVPANAPLKESSKFRYIGQEGVARVDNDAKVSGAPVFGLDVALPGMLTVCVLHPPVPGGTLVELGDAEARKSPGVLAVHQTSFGAAVVAENTWAAIKGKLLLKPRWDLSKAEQRSRDEIEADYRALLDRPGAKAAAVGDPDRAAQAAEAVTQDYTFPYLAHAPLEPLNAVIEFDGKKARITTGCQFQTVDQAAAAQVLGIPPQDVEIVTKMAGGSFGRRANPAADYIREAAEIARIHGGGAPLKVMWTRKEDIQSGFYRPLYLHRIRAALGADKRIEAWSHRIVGQSIGDGTPFAPYMIKDDVDYTSVEGARENIYNIPNFGVDLHTTKSSVPVLWWRSVGFTHTIYAVETMVDLLAQQAGADPVAFRLRHVTDARLAGVLTAARDASDWSTRAGTSGVAVAKCFDTYVAHVAEVEAAPGGATRVRRVTCAVDCGQVVNPDVIRAQVEGGVAFALSAILFGEISLGKSAVEQENFDSYRLLRISEMPEVNVHIVKSDAAPTGIGEPPVPTVGPAVANAVRRVSGKLPTILPFSRSGLS